MKVPTCGDRGRAPISAHDGQVLVAAQGMALTRQTATPALLTQAWPAGVGHCFYLSCPLDRFGNGGSERPEHLREALLPPPGPPAACREGHLPRSSTPRPLALPRQLPRHPFL